MSSCHHLSGFLSGYSVLNHIELISGILSLVKELSERSPDEGRVIMGALPNDEHIGDITLMSILLKYMDSAAYCVEEQETVELKKVLIHYGHVLHVLNINHIHMSQDTALCLFMLIHSTHPATNSAVYGVLKLIEEAPYKKMLTPFINVMLHNFSRHKESDVISIIEALTITISLFGEDIIKYSERLFSHPDPIMLNKVLLKLTRILGQDKRHTPSLYVHNWTPVQLTHIQLDHLFNHPQLPCLLVVLEKLSTHPIFDTQVENKPILTAVLKLDELELLTLEQKLQSLNELDRDKWLLHIKAATSPNLHSFYSDSNTKRLSFTHTLTSECGVNSPFKSF
ncbi:MAG: hypothetical protein NTW08_02315 [Gammaproteobacteria bacterium]|nr:hypothetical protein [Gammaproteobacteria bacterium]